MTVYAPIPSEGVSRPYFTARDVLAMQEAGLFEDVKQIEVMDGEILVMNAEASPHRKLRNRLTAALDSWLGRQNVTLMACATPTVYLDPDQFVQPDIAVYPRAAEDRELHIADIILAIEVSHTSLPYDDGRKRRKYAAAGLAHYWIIDVEARQLITYAAPVAGDYGQRLVHDAHAIVPCAALPGWSLDLSAVFA